MEEASLDAKKKVAECISSGRNESQNSGAQASGDWLQSTLTEDDDTRNLLSLGLELNPNLSIMVKETHRNTFGKFDLTNFQINTATWCISNVNSCGHHSKCVGSSRFVPDVVRTVPFRARRKFRTS